MLLIRVIDIMGEILMKIINSDEEFEQFYYYKKSKPDKYPAKYPCIVERVYHDGGLGGSQVEHRIFAIPEDAEPLAYLRGMIAYKETV
jgi:hypothetical protein